MSLLNNPPRALAQKVAQVRSVAMNPLNPKKLLLTKWTAVTPVDKQKHFLVSKVIQPDLPDGPIEWVELESVFSKATQVIAWRALQNADVWRLGWV
jgi:tryptophan-rich hypothetical protein